MNKIINLSQAQKICRQLKKAGKTIVLVGGCFDIFHYGHFSFLKKAASFGDILIIALENDKKVRQLKGKNRPITNQINRAEILASFQFVSYVLLLPNLTGFKSYSDLTRQLVPDIIAVTSGDKHLEDKKKQAKLVKGRVKVIPCVNTPSTSELLRLIKKEL